MTKSINLNLSASELKPFLKYFFGLITVHVLFVYYVKNLMGVSINDPIYVLIKMWKEIFLIGLIVIAIIQYLLNKERILISLTDLAILIFIFLGLIYVLFAPNLTTAIWSFRSLYQIFGFYMLGRLFSLQGNQLKKFLTVLLIMGCLTSLFGIIQVKFLGPDFFKEVYGVDEVAVALTSYGYSNIRASSTFITPHEFGLFLVLCFLFASYLVKESHIKKNVFLVSVFILVIGLMLSLSRSSLVIAILSGGLFWVNSFKRFSIFLLVCFIGSIMFFLFGAVDNILSVIQGKDPSSQGRIEVINQFANHIAEHPLGSGLGTVGVVVRRFQPDAPQFEGEVFNIIAMTSIIGGIVYISILCVAGYKILSASVWGNRNLNHMIIIIMAALFLRELILPRDFTNYSLGWFLIGSTLSHSAMIKVGSSNHIKERS